MPIYSYRCENCGHAEDVLQKMSAPQLTICPACGADAYRKQVTAAGFQLKGSGWYVTDFRNGQAAPAAAKPEKSDASDAPATGETKTDKPAATPAEASTTTKADAPAPAPAPKAAPPAATS